MTLTHVLYCGYIHNCVVDYFLSILHKVERWHLKESKLVAIIYCACLAAVEWEKSTLRKMLELNSKWRLRCCELPQAILMLLLKKLLVYFNVKQRLSQNLITPTFFPYSITVRLKSME